MSLQTDSILVSIGCRSVRGIPRTLTVFLLALALAAAMAAAPIARAQGQPPQPGSAPPKETLELFNDLDDINKLSALNPLHLTPEQLDKMIIVVSAAQADYEKKLTALKLASIHSIASEVPEMKRRALAGGAVPKTFLDRVIALSQSFLTRKDRLDADALIGMATQLRGILTPQQVDTAVQLIKEQAPKDGMSTRGANDKWFNAYVLQVFISYPRIVPLLKEMRAAAAGNTAGNAGAGA
ncbi:MAG TPA: hypothetical protein VFB38_24310 [Chthonomonadaceae bacterium]|nr:hypothetical protein [Chthonomonadaceae bacterium]